MNTPLPHIALQPSEEEVAVRESVAKICGSFGEGYQRACYDSGKGPDELWNALAEAGFVGVNLGEEWGGGGLGMTGLTWVIEECLRAGFGGMRIIVSAGMSGTMIERHGTPEQKKRWLPGIASGKLKFSFGITEPDAGSNTNKLKTEIRRDGDGYVLNGQKYYVSAVTGATHVMVVAKVKDDTSTRARFCLAVMDVHAPGFTRQPIAVQYISAESEDTLFFDNVRFSEDDLVGGLDGGLKVLFDALNPERIAVAAAAAGTGLLALQKAVAYVKSRSVWGQPIGAHQAVAHPLARVKMELDTARLMTRKAAALWDAGVDDSGESANAAKFFAAEAGIHAVDAAVQVHGGNGMSIEYGVSDLWWQARLWKVAPVSTEMILNHVAQHSLGLPRSY